MKLYATVSSERATKGQGGNHHINIAINIDDEKNPRFRMFITKREDESTDIVLIDLEKPYPNTIFETTIKGKKQKGECEHIRKNGQYFTGNCPICKN